MDTRAKLLKKLEANRNRYLSGAEVARELGVSRNAIWKAIGKLKEDGYKIEGRAKVGYRLLGGVNILSIDGIKTFLKGSPNMEIFDTISSTNDYCKGQRLTETPLLVVANKQTNGKGRLGRTFFSPPSSGLYMTIGLKPSFPLEHALFVTMATAVAVSHAIEDVADIKTRIKWVNDIYYQGKKICGILTEATTNLETGEVDGLIIGIGINCFSSSVPKELEGIAGYISSNKNLFSRNELAAKVYDNIMDALGRLEDRSFLPEYRNRCMLLGKPILVHQHGGMSIKATAVDIDQNGGLVVEYLEGPKMRTMETLVSGEVSIRNDF